MVSKNTASIDWVRARGQKEGGDRTGDRRLKENDK